MAAPGTARPSSPSTAATRPRLDRVDAGLPVRLGAAAVRRHRRRRVSWSSAASANVERMAPHLTHVGVHDHGFNNVSTYGNLWRLMNEGRIEASDVGAALLRAGAEGQRRRAGRAAGRDLPDGGLHPLVQRPAVAVRRHDPLAAARWRCPSARPPLMRRTGRAGQPARPARRARRNTAGYNVCYGEGRDAYDVAAARRTRAIFNTNNGIVPLPHTQQGYSPFSTWTRGLAWAMLGFAEQLECLATLARRRSSSRVRRPRGAVEDVVHARGRPGHLRLLHRAHRQPTASPTGTPARPAWRSFGDYLRPPGRSVQRPRAGRQLRRRDRRARAAAARPLSAGRAAKTARATSQAGLTTLDTLFDPPSRTSATDATHQGLILHSVYHRPNGWDHVPARPQGAVRRIEHVGRLPRSRGRALRPAPGHGRAVPHVLRPGGAGVSDRVASRWSPAAPAGIGLGIARALARAGWTLALCGMRPAAESPRSSTTCEPPARRRRLLAAPTSAWPATAPRLLDAVARALRPARRAGQQRRHGASVRADLLDADRGELRGSDPHQPAGPVLPDPGWSRACMIARTARLRAGRSRGGSSSSPRSRRSWRRPTAATTASARPGWRWPPSCSRSGWRRSASPCTKSAPASSPPT